MHVLNAGIFRRDADWRAQAADWERVMRVNLDAN